MDIAGDLPATVETVTSKHITNCISASISDDGSTAMIVFTTAGRDGAKDEKFAITCGVEQLPWLRAVFHDVLSRLPPGKPLNEHAAVFGTPGPTGIEQIDLSIAEGRIILRMCPGRAEEIPWTFTLDTALKLAALLNDIPAKLRELKKMQELQGVCDTIGPVQGSS